MIKKFDKWINEDFAQVGVAPAGNVQGMGDAIPPTATSTGSGDLWPSLGAPSSLAKLKKSKRTKHPKRDRRKEKMMMKNTLQEAEKVLESVDPIKWSGGDVARMPIIGKVTTKAIGPFEESEYDIVEVIKDPKDRDVYIANFWYKKGVPQLIHSELVKEFVPVSNEAEGPSVTQSIGYPSKVVVSGDSAEKNQEAIIKAIQEADPKCKGINSPKPLYYPATGKVVGIMDSTCLRALSVALRKVDPGLKAEIKK
jgi:hypothetical protein